MTTYTKTELKRKRGFELINILKSLIKTVLIEMTK